MARTFPARYEGECSECFGAIFEGDEIGYVDDEICCESCCEAAEDHRGCIRFEGSDEAKSS